MLTHRFDDALQFAARAHRDQWRKATRIPYIAHLLGVCSLVLDYGGDEDQAIGGLLHDAVEDQGGEEMLATISDRFGSRVADIVLACSDSTDQAKEPWDDRKRRYIAEIAGKSDDAVLVTTCDKLHNATAILTDLEQIGPAVFDRFTAGRDGTLWYYRELATALSDRLPGALTDRLAETVSRMEMAA